LQVLVHTESVGSGLQNQADRRLAQRRRPWASPAVERVDRAGRGWRPAGLL